MSRTVTICEHADCGACYRCRLRRTESEFEALREAQALERKVDALLRPKVPEQPRLL
jgi:hypothetical protein